MKTAVIINGVIQNTDFLHLGKSTMDILFLKLRNKTCLFYVMAIFSSKF